MTKNKSNAKKTLTRISAELNIKTYSFKKITNI